MEQEERARPDRRRLMWLLTPVAVLFVVGTVASALTPALAARHPLLLILLEARNRNLVLARRVDLVPFVLVATLRRTLTDPIYFLLGRWYGDRVVRWLENEGGGGAFVRVTERLFTKAAYPMVFLFPGALVCALAGVTGMPPAAFVVLNVSGTVAMVFVLRAFGDVLSGPVDALVGFFDRNLVTTTAVTVALVLLWLLTYRWRGETAVPTVSSLAEELEDEGPRPDPSDVEQGVETDRDPG